MLDVDQLPKTKITSLPTVCFKDRINLTLACRWFIYAENRILWNGKSNDRSNRDITKGF